MTKPTGIDTRRSKWIESMGLRVRQYLFVGQGEVDRVILYDWPKGNERQCDHTVVMTVFNDGSFMTALDDGCLHFDKAAACLQAMALAAEGVGDE